MTTLAATATDLSPNPGALRGAAPAGYPEALALHAGLLLGLMGLAALRPAGPASAWPAPAVAGALGALVLGTFLLGRLRPAAAVVRFLGGVPFALTSLGFAAASGLAGTLVLQNPSAQDAARLGAALPWLQKLGVTDVFRSPWFGAQVVALLVCLGLVAGRRSRPWNLRTAAFQATHLGLALVLAGGIFGTLCSRFGQLRLVEGEEGAAVELERGGRAALASPVKLTAFQVEPFALEATLGTLEGERMKPQASGRALPTLAPGARFELGGWQVECLDALPSAASELQLVPASEGSPALELTLQAHGGAARFPLAPQLGVRALPGGLVTALVEVADEDLARASADVKAAWDRDPSPGAVYLVHGERFGRLTRSLDGKTGWAEGEAARRPVQVGPLSLAPGPVFPARLQGRWTARQGLVPDPTGAAHVVARRGAETREGWIASGPEGADRLELDAGRFLMLMPPQPKAFRSRLRVAGAEREVRVNGPIAVDGWTLSQVSFEVDAAGRAVSVLKAVQDPSMPAVYGGLFLLLAGTLGMLWVVPGTLRGDA